MTLIYELDTKILKTYLQNFLDQGFEKWEHYKQTHRHTDRRDRTQNHAALSGDSNSDHNADNNINVYDAVMTAKATARAGSVHKHVLCEAEVASVHSSNKRASAARLT